MTKTVIEDVIKLAPVVEIREEFVGTDPGEDEPAVGRVVELELWRDASGDTDGSWAIDIRGPEPGRVRRYLLHTSVDVLALSDRVLRRTTAE